MWLVDMVKGNETMMGVGGVAKQTMKEDIPDLRYVRLSMCLQCLPSPFIAPY